jgi:hypothetical protein
LIDKNKCCNKSGEGNFFFSRRCFCLHQRFLGQAKEKRKRDATLKPSLSSSLLLSISSKSAYGLAMHYKKKSFCVAAMHETLWQIILSNWKGTQWDVMILTNGSVYTCMHCHKFFALCACVLCGASALKTVEFLEVQHRGAFGMLR